MRTRISKEELDKFERDGIFMHEPTQKRIKETLEHIDVEMTDGKRYMLASLVFSAIMIVGMLTDLIIFWIGGLVGVILMWYWGSKCHQKINRLFGYIDGIMYATIELNKDMIHFRNKIEPKLTPEFEEEVRKLVED